MKLSKIKWLWAAGLIAVMLPFIIAFLYIFRPFNRVFRKTCRTYFWLTKTKINQFGDFDKSANIIVLNHQGIMDILYLEAYYPLDLCWIAKKELGDIPLYGHALKAPKMILVDREDRKSLLFLLKEAKDRLSKGRILAIFPEGTRGSGNEEFLEFKYGAKLLIEKFNLKVQPIVMVNTRKLFDHSKQEIISNEADIICMNAYTPDFNNTQWYSELRSNMHKKYLEHYHKLNKL